MSNNYNKPQIVTCIMALVGLFIPLLKYSGYTTVKTISFKEAPDGKIMIGILVIALIVCCIQLQKNNLALRLLSFALFIAAGIIFWIDMGTVDGLIKYTSAIKYGIGFYIIIAGIAISLILGLLDIFTNLSDSKRSYPADYADIINKRYNDTMPINNMMTNQNMAQPMAQPVVQPMAQPVIQPSVSPVEEHPNPSISANSMRLSDLVGNEQTNNNESNINNN